MLTADEFKTAYAIVRRRHVIAFALVSAVYVIVIGALGALIHSFAERFAHWYVERGGSEFSLLLLGLTVIAALAAPAIAAFRLVEHRDRRDSRVVCPHCHQLLAQRHHLLDEPVILTGNCDKCGERVLSDTPASAAPPAHLLMVDDFKAGFSAYFRRMVVPLLGLAGAFVLWLVLAGALASQFREPLLALLEPRFGEEWARDMLPAVVLLPAIIAVFGGFALIILREQKRTRDPRVTCPQCRQELEYDPLTTVATRRCKRCMAVVLAEPETLAAAEPLLTLSEFRAAQSTYMGRSRYYLIAFGVAMIPFFFLPMACSKSLEDRFGQAGTTVLTGIAMVLPLLAIGAPLFIRDTKLRRKLRLKCHHCGRSLMCSLVVATRNCTNCGRRVLAEDELRPLTRHAVPA